MARTLQDSFRWETLGGRGGWSKREVLLSSHGEKSSVEKKHVLEACANSVCRCVSVPMLLVSYLAEVKNCEAGVCPYGQPRWLHQRDQNPLVIALRAWKLIHGLWIRTNYIGLLGGKAGHRSEDNVCQSPQPSKHTEMCANANWYAALNWGLTGTYFGGSCTEVTRWMRQIGIGPEGKRSRKRQPGT